MHIVELGVVAGPGGAVRDSLSWRSVAWRGVAWRGVAWRGVAWMCRCVQCVRVSRGTVMLVLYGVRVGGDWAALCGREFTEREAAGQSATERPVG